MISLGDLRVSPLLTPGLSGDPAFGAAGTALETLLRGVVGSTPGLLLWHRLALTAGSDVPAMLPPIRRVTESAGGLAPLSEAELELLAWQLHVDFRETAKTPERLAEMVRRSVPWHRIKGTPASIRAALALFGLEAKIEEGGRHWADYQLGLHGVDDLDGVATAVRVASEMAPVRCRLFRVYNDEFDRRPIVLSKGPVLSDGVLSFFSGTTVPGAEETVVSLGKRLSVLFPAHAHAGLFGWQELHALLARRLNRFIVGLSRLSAVYEGRKPFVFGGLASLLEERERMGRGFGTSRRSKAQAVPTEGFDVLGGSHFRLGTTWMEVPGTRFSLGLSALSGADGMTRRVRADELPAETAGFTAARGARPAPVSFAWDVIDQFVARRMTRIVLGLSRLSEVYPANHMYFFGEQLTLPARRERLPVGFVAARRTKSQAVPTESWDMLGGSNFRLGTTWRTVTEPPFVLGASALSGPDGMTRRVGVDEVLAAGTALATEPRERPDGGVGGLAFETALRTEERYSRMRWSHEPWAHRRWWNRIAVANLKQEEETI